MQQAFQKPAMGELQAKDYLASGDIDGLRQYLGGSENGLEAYINGNGLDQRQEHQPPFQRKKLQLLSFDDLQNLPIRNWLIKSMLFEDSISMMYGPSGGGKTFMALDLALHVAFGKEWNGHRVKKGRVIYVCGEGVLGLARRVNAWLQHYDSIEGKPDIEITKSPVQMLDYTQAGELLDALRDRQDVALVIIDTLAANFGSGSENDSKDMCRFMGVMHEIRELINGSVLIIHHTGHANEERARGSTVLRAALDTEFRVARDKNDEKLIGLEVTKQKDAEAIESKGFRFEVIELPETDEDGDAITSCVVIHQPHETPQLAGGKGRRSNSLVSKTLRLAEKLDAETKQGWISKERLHEEMRQEGFCKTKS